jgi:hypothetical protein
MKDLRKPEDRLIDDLVESEERSTFFATVENGLIQRMATGIQVAKGSLGWGGPLAVVAVAGSLVTALLVWTSAPNDVAIVKVDPSAPSELTINDQTAPVVAPSVNAPSVNTPSADAPAPTTASESTTAVRTKPSARTEPRSAPSNMHATASATSTLAERARREADSLRTELAATTDVAQRLSLRYDLGVRLRLIGSTEESLNMLASVANQAHDMGAMVLSARSSQQAAVAAYDLGRSVLAVELLETALERYPDKGASAYRRWQQQLNEWKR